MLPDLAPLNSDYNEADADSADDDALLIYVLLEALAEHRRVVTIPVDSEQMRLWKGLLPSLVEQCRVGEAWRHGEGRDYHCHRLNSNRGDGATAIGMLVDIDARETVCGCGKDVFPEEWEIADMPLRDVAKKYCVRAVILPLFAKVLVGEVGLEEGFNLKMGDDVAGKDGGSGSGGGCRGCGSEKAEGGGELKACAKCMKVKYCGRTCQRADWKRHKKECVAKQ